MVVFRILTHDAYVKSNEDGPIVTPGITMHDIRVAFRIEKLWNHYWGQGKARLPRKGWVFTGQRSMAIRFWGELYARLSPNWKEEMATARAKQRRGWLRKQGKPTGLRKYQPKKRKTPRWKKMKWKNRALRGKLATARSTHIETEVAREAAREELLALHRSLPR